MYRALMCLIFSVALQSGVLGSAEKPERRALAEYYAPVVYQESKSAVLDYITRFDYDGDWNGANNWRNAYRYELRAYVYYGVVESTNHVFITYAFYHPRDFTARPLEGMAPKTEHENDMEGCMLVVERDKTRWGRPILLETLAHDHFYKYDNPKYRRVKKLKNALPLDGSIVFLKEVDNTHHQQPAVYIEPEGHGVKAATEQVRAEGFKHPGIIYRFAGRGAEVPRNNNDPDVSYDLISIEDSLWAKRSEIGPSSLYCCGDSYALPGGQTVLFGSAFNGPIGGCAAKPPWGWDQANDGLIEKGDLFRNPLRAVAAQVQVEGWGGTYVHNPYLTLETSIASKPGTLCSESAVSKTLGQSVATSLLGIGKTLFSGGFNSQRIGDRAKQLFLTNTVLLEWSRLADFERWSWNKSLAEPLLPKLLTENLRDQIQLSFAKDLGFSSPALNVPARYFDSLVMNYKCAVEGATGRVFWMYEGMKVFDEAHSTSFPLKKSDGWAADGVDLSKSERWDRNLNIVQLKLEILGPNQETLASVDPAKADAAAQASSNLLVINSIIFDRHAFSDTFER
ncbi:MAG: hypothetical protein L0387_12380 [Acidobacteria bacterium]|nr:hypothetical protein [Acidobacteriota bacterium]MCI0722355.1 hypothetical protein [Acidobacteriota bacterium]